MCVQKPKLHLLDELQQGYVKADVKIFAYFSHINCTLPACVYETVAVSLVSDGVGFIKHNAF